MIATVFPEIALASDFPVSVLIFFLHVKHTFLYLQFTCLRFFTSLHVRDVFIKLLGMALGFEKIYHEPAPRNGPE